MAKRITLTSLWTTDPLPKEIDNKQSSTSTEEEILLTESRLRIDQDEMTSCDDECAIEAKSQDSPTASSPAQRFESGTMPTVTTEDCQDIALYLYEMPKQPRIKFPMTRFGEKLRSFNPDWYKTCSWLEYSVNQNAAYCFPCRWFSSRLNRPDAPFTQIGYRDWKHATGQKGRLIEHKKSTAHVEAFHTWEEYKLNLQRGTTITRCLDKIGMNVIKENRHYVKTIAEIILLRARQEISLRGHDETEESLNPGNFLSLLTFIGNHDEIVGKRIKEGPQNSKYTSPDIQNELLGIMGDMVLQTISNEVQNAGIYSLLADETKDISRKEQLSIVLRYVKNGSVYEPFVGYTFAELLDAESLYKYICNVIQSCNLLPENCVCQCYDGASVMSGRCSGVQARFRVCAPMALYIHCCAHRLNLVLVDSIKGVPIAQDFFSLLEAAYVFLSTGKFNALFEKVQSEQSPGKQPRRLKRLVETRWACRLEAIRAFKETFGAVVTTLKSISEGMQRERAIEAKGLLLQIFEFKFVLCLVMFNHIFSLTNGLSKTLQDPDLDFSAAISLVDATIETLESYRSEKQWKEFWNEALMVADDHGIEISSLPRKRKHKLPARLCDALVTTTVGHREELSTEDQYCVIIYYRVLDCMIDELNKRFNNESKLCMKGISACSPKSKYFLDFATVKPILENYKISEEDLHIELIQAKKVLRNEHMGNIHEVNDKLRPLKEAFPELLRLLNIALTIAVSSAACELSFSSLKRTKTYLRSTMSQLRLNNLAILSIESDIASTLPLEVVVDRFACQHKNRKICLL